jgi:hypothetical protein
MGFVEIAALIILIISSLAGFACIFFTTFGTLIIFIGVVIYALLTGLSVIDLKTLLALLALYALGEIAEYVSVIFGIKRLGASNAAIAGAIVGGVLGAALGAGFFGIGLIFGAFLGMFLGAFLVELAIKKDIKKSLKAGTGGVLGRLGSIAVKVVIAIAMFVIITGSIIRSGEVPVTGPGSENSAPPVREPAAGGGSE